MDTPILEQINFPSDLKKLNIAELPALCQEIRDYLIETVSKTGGHLASNLGTVELLVALHYNFQFDGHDRLVFDVGHQCYTHKILTGRRKDFLSLRQLNGISGFPNPSESCYDSFISGHGNTALSVAIGIARAKKLRGEDGRVIALVGDGAFTGGMVYEGLNNVEGLNNLIVILNDNKMSIGKNVGAMAHYFTKLRASNSYSQMKENVESSLEKIPLLGTPVTSLLRNVKQDIRRKVYHSTFFEEMGFNYIGSVDGNNVAALAELFAELPALRKPWFLHVTTVKGKGFSPAEKNPGEFHGVSSFDPDCMRDPETSPKASFSEEFGQHLLLLGKNNASLCAITAAMKYGTGLQYFAHEYPQRFFDVGMAEQHAVTFAAGLASAGMTPVVAIYSTFLQRCYDQLIHDVCLTQQNVFLAIDRAGFVPGDGETHQGIYDVGFLSQLSIPTWTVSNYQELHIWLPQILALTGPRALRYARGEEAPLLAAWKGEMTPFSIKRHSAPAQCLLVGYGAELEELLLAAELLQKDGVGTDVCKMIQLYPLPVGFVQQLQNYALIAFAEECVEAGSVGNRLRLALQSAGWQGSFLHFCVRTANLPHATVKEIRASQGMDASTIYHSIREKL